MMRTPEHTCCKKIFTGYGMQGKVCSRGARFEHDEKWYCGMHHPPTIKEKAQAKERQWEARRNVAMANDEYRRAAAEERDRRAALYPELLAFAQQLASRGIADGPTMAKCRAIIAKATEYPPPSAPEHSP